VRVTEQVQGGGLGKDRQMQGTHPPIPQLGRDQKTLVRGVPAASGVQGDVKRRAWRRGPRG
jgi:hypothetical protein